MDKVAERNPIRANGIESEDEPEDPKAIERERKALKTVRKLEKFIAKKANKGFWEKFLKKDESSGSKLP